MIDDTPQELEEDLRAQAAQLEYLLPKVMRRLFALERDHPAMELPLAQLRVCTILHAEPRTLSAISEELGISVSATTQIADRLEKVGMVERVVGQGDRRTKKLQLSSYGREIMESRQEQRIQRAMLALKPLTPEQRESALQAVLVLVEAAKAIAPAVPYEDPTGIRQEP